MNRKRTKLIGVLLALGLLAGACGGNTKDDTAKAGPATTKADVPAVVDPTKTGAAELRASLTSLLSEHVYLAGITTGTALAGQDFKPAAAALDANTQALQDAMSSVYGEAGGEQFGALWRKHIGFFVDYTTGRATNDEAKVAKARADLDGYRADFGAFIESATKGGLPKEAVAEGLKPHLTTLFAAIDAQASKSPTATAKLKAAADHMPKTAATLAGAIVKQFPDKFSG